MSEQAGDSPLQAARADVIHAAHKAASHAVQSKTGFGGPVNYSWVFKDDILRAALDVFEWQAKVEALREEASVHWHGDCDECSERWDRITAAEAELADARRRREGAA